MSPEQREALQWAVKVLDEVMEGDEPQATIRAALTAPAPACKYGCQGGYIFPKEWTEPMNTRPCPDCNAGEGSSARATECSECGWIPDNGPGSFNGGFYRQCDKHRSKP